MLHPLRKVTGHILIEIEMELHFINVLLAIVAVIDLETSAMMQLVMLCCRTMTVTDNVCVTVKVLLSLLIHCQYCITHRCTVWRV